METLNQTSSLNSFCCLCQINNLKVEIKKMVQQMTPYSTEYVYYIVVVRINEEQDPIVLEKLLFNKEFKSFSVAGAFKDKVYLCCQ